MEDLTKEIIAHTGCQNVKLIDGVYYLRFFQHDRNMLRNIRTDGTDLNPVMSTTPENRIRTFYLFNTGTMMAEKLNTVPIVFCVSSRLNDGIKGDYEHWTLGGILHRDDGPAYVAEYLNAEGIIATMMNMYFVFGVRKRSGGSSLELYQNYKKEDGGIIRFNKAIFECTYCPEEGDSTDTLSWPYVQRLTLSMGRELNVDGNRQLAAKNAIARWNLHQGLGSGIYPLKMVMKGFHECWNSGVLQQRNIESVRSTWIRINEEDKIKMSPATLRRGELSNPKFDAEFKQLINRVGFVDKPFYDDPIIELGVLTDLPKFLSDDDD